MPPAERPLGSPIQATLIPGWYICSERSTFDTYHKTPSISRTKSQNLNVSCLIMQLSLLNQLKPCVKSRMKM